MSFWGWIGKVVETGRIGDQELTVEWRIPDVLSKSGSGEVYYDSLSFGSPGHWRLSLWPNRTDETRIPPSGWMDLRLRRCNGGPPETLNVRVGIKGAAGVEKERESQREFSTREWTCDWAEFCTRSELEQHRSRLMPDDVLIITCDIKTPSAARVKRRSARIRELKERMEVGVVNKKVQGKTKVSKKRKFQERKEINVVTKKAQGKRKSPPTKRKFPDKGNITQKVRGKRKSSPTKRKFSESNEANVVTKKVQGKRKSSPTKRKFLESKKARVISKMVQGKGNTSKMKKFPRSKDRRTAANVSKR